MRHVIICGQAPLSFIHPPEAEVWVINGPHFPPRWDVLFQLHGLHHIEEKHGTHYVEWLKGVATNGGRLIMPAGHLVRGAEAYPLAAIKGAYASAWLDSSFPLAIAFALYENTITDGASPVHELWLDGVLYRPRGNDGGDEGWSVPCVSHWLGRAEGMGVKVRVPPGCGLLEPQPHVYGFDGPGSV